MFQRNQFTPERKAAAMEVGNPHWAGLDSFFFHAMMIEVRETFRTSGPRFLESSTEEG